jgi:hypothetical protein
MIKELIFILVIIVIILAVIARQPRSILRAENADSTPINAKSQDLTSSADIHSSATSARTAARTTARTTERTTARTSSRVRFSPEKKERVYNVKTGAIVGESIVPVEESEN